MIYYTAAAAVVTVGVGAYTATKSAKTQANAINNAAAVQADSAARQLDVQKQMFDQEREDFAPYQQMGLKGVADLNAYNSMGDQSMYTQMTPDEVKAVSRQKPIKDWKGQTIGFKPSEYSAGQTYYKDRSGKIIQASQYDKLAKDPGKMPDYDELRAGLNYDAEVTNKLADYKSSPAFQAQNTLGQQALQRSLNARGLNYGATGASAGAELEQKLIATDYDKYRQGLEGRYGTLVGDVTDRYKALQGQYAIKRDQNSEGYNQLLDMVKVGQGAANSAGAAAGQNAQNASNTFASLGNAQANAAMAQGRNSAQMYSNLGAIPGQAASTVQSLSSMGGGNWFGSGSGVDTSNMGGGSVGTTTGYWD